MSSTLRNMFNHVKRLGRKHFLSDGEVTPQFFLEFDHVNNSSDPTLLQAVVGWSNDTEKSVVMNSLRAQVISYGSLHRYCFIHEAWMAPPSSKQRPSLSPDRTEHLCVFAHERNGRSLFGLWNIRRHPTGGPTLATWRELDAVEHDGGLPMFGEPTRSIQ